MGLFNTDKNLAEQLAELVAANAELTDRVSAAEACAEEKIQALAAAIDERDKDRQAHAASLAEYAEAVTAKDSEIEDLKAKLANPPAAYADATEGVSGAVAEGGDGEQTSYWSRYYAIEDGGERTRFWRKNRENLENEQRQRR
jgi:chromosome segregation ATPase